MHKKRSLQKPFLQKPLDIMCRCTNKSSSFCDMTKKNPIQFLFSSQKKSFHSSPFGYWSWWPSVCSCGTGCPGGTYQSTFWVPRTWAPPGRKNINQLIDRSINRLYLEERRVQKARDLHYCVPGLARGGPRPDGDGVVGRTNALAPEIWKKKFKKVLSMREGARDEKHNWELLRKKCASC